MFVLHPQDQTSFELLGSVYPLPEDLAWVFKLICEIDFDYLMRMDQIQAIFDLNDFSEGLDAYGWQMAELGYDLELVVKEDQIAWSLVLLRCQTE